MVIRRTHSLRRRLSARRRRRNRLNRTRAGRRARQIILARALAFIPGYSQAKAAVDTTRDAVQLAQTGVQAAQDYLVHIDQANERRNHRELTSARQLAPRHVHPLKPHPMPRRRTRRRSLYKRKRRRSKKYTVKRRRRRSMFKRNVRHRHSLRLIPGGFPQTKTVKLRVYKQCAIHSPGTGVAWGYIIFHPANPWDPMISMRTTPSASGTHRALAFTLKNGTDITPRPQPYGWDEWANAYPRYQVLGSKTTINFVQGSNSPASTTQFVCGFSRQFNDVANPYVPATFGEKYANISYTELSDMLNVKVIKKPIIVEQIGVGTALSGGARSVSFNYSLKKSIRAWKKAGGKELNETGGYGGATFPPSNPGYSPQRLFIMGDLAGDSASITMNAFLTIDYTIKFSKAPIEDASTV